MATLAELKAELAAAPNNLQIAQGWVSSYCTKAAGCKDNPTWGDCLLGCPPKCGPSNPTACQSAKGSVQSYQNVINTYPALIASMQNSGGSGGGSNGKRVADSNLIRNIILIVLGVGVLVGLYFWAKKKGWIGKGTVATA